MRRRTFVATLAFGVVFAVSSLYAARPVEWKNLDKSHYLAGRMTSSGYMRGKVVYVDCRDYGDRRGVESMRSMEDAWQTFKMKQFVMLGSHCGSASAKKIARIAKGLRLTYPIYKEAGVVHSQGSEELEPREDGFVYVVGPTGRILYRGIDERRAYGIVASALMAMRRPQTSAQWKHYIDFYIDVLPGRALLEIEEFHKAFPDEAKVYDSVRKHLSGDEDIQRVAKLEMLTQQAKDYDFKDKNARRLSDEKVQLAIDAFSDLKTSENPAVAQEAKNCIAELMWTAARLKAN